MQASYIDPLACSECTREEETKFKSGMNDNLLYEGLIRFREGGGKISFDSGPCSVSSKSTRLHKCPSLCLADQLVVLRGSGGFLGAPSTLAKKTTQRLCS